MEYLANNWPFYEGDQINIFYSVGLVILGLLVVNVCSAIRQKHSIAKISRSFFSEVAGGNPLENRIRKILLFFLALSFCVLVLDISINGQQLAPTLI